MDPLQPGEEVMYWRWVTIRSRLEDVLGKQSGLPAPLAAYALDHAEALRLDHVRWLREEYGVPSDPSTEELLRLLEHGNDEPSGPTAPRRAVVEQVKDHSDLFGEGYLDEVREGWPGEPE